MASLGRRRGTRASSQGSSFAKLICLLLTIALFLTIGLALLFQLSAPPTSSSAKLPVLQAVPNRLRKPQLEVSVPLVEEEEVPMEKDVHKDDEKADGKAFPYPVEQVPANYDIASKYTPMGGHRYREYIKGDSPYRITPELCEASDNVARSRRLHIKASMQWAWKQYADVSLGMDELLPVSGRGKNNWGGQGITLVDALDTLWVMGLRDEFNEATAWVRDHLDHSTCNQKVSVFETTIRDLGGLLSAYDLSGEQVFLDKALDLGERLLKSFRTATGLPYSQVNLQNGATGRLSWARGSIVAEFGTLQVENRYLSKMTGRKEFAAKTERVYEVLREVDPGNGLFPYFWDIDGKGGETLADGVTPKPRPLNSVLTFGAMGDSLYEYFLKTWIQGGRTEPLYRQMYDKAIDSMHKELLQTSTPSGLIYIADKDRDRINHKMDHLVCFMGGLLGLGAYTDPLGMDSERAQRDMKTAKALTYTCYQMYARMSTGISPEFVQFYEGRDFQIGSGAPHYLLRPEAVESFYILNKITGDPVYREWGWEVFQSIEKYCKVEHGYGALSNVQDVNGRPRDSMESFFFAELMKYLYLLQDPDSEIDPLHKHVFNTEAHPLRIFPVIDEQGGKVAVR